MNSCGSTDYRCNAFKIIQNIFLGHGSVLSCFAVFTLSGTRTLVRPSISSSSCCVLTLIQCSFVLAPHRLSLQVTSVRPPGATIIGRPLQRSQCCREGICHKPSPGRCVSTPGAHCESFHNVTPLKHPHTAAPETTEFESCSVMIILRVIRMCYGLVYPHAYIYLGVNDPGKHIA